MKDPNKTYEPLKQSFRVAIKRKDEESTHYIIRDVYDLELIQWVINDELSRYEMDSIKWVPIPALEEV